MSVVIFASFANAQSARIDKTPSGDVTPLPAVRLVETEVDRVGRTRSFYGRIAAKETVELSFEVGGNLRQFDPREGTSISSGSVIARLDLDPFERALRRAELNRKQALRAQSRAEKLAKSGAGPTVRAEDATTIADLALVALMDAKEALEDATMVAPFDALVSKRLGTTFANVTPGQPIVSLHDMSEVRVEFDLPERLFLSVPDPDVVRFEGVLPSGDITPLSLVEFEAQTGAIGQSYRVALAIPAERTAGLIPGASMTVNAIVPATDPNGVLPASSILSANDRGFEVMVFSPTGARTGIVEKRHVTLSAPGGTSFRVKGLDDGEKIVATGGHLLTHGQAVRRYEGLTVEEK